MEKDVSYEEVVSHFDYGDRDLEQEAEHIYRAQWRVEDVKKNIELLSDFFVMRLKHEKFRIVLDYDPEFPRSRIRVLILRKVKND